MRPRGPALKREQQRDDADGLERTDGDTGTGNPADLGEPVPCQREGKQDQPGSGSRA